MASWWQQKLLTNAPEPKYFLYDLNGDICRISVSVNGKEFLHEIYQAKRIARYSSTGRINYHDGPHTWSDTCRYESLQALMEAREWPQAPVDPSIDSDTTSDSLDLATRVEHDIAAANASLAKLAVSLKELSETKANPSTQ